MGNKNDINPSSEQFDLWGFKLVFLVSHKVKYSGGFFCVRLSTDRLCRVQSVVGVEEYVCGILLFDGSNYSRHIHCVQTEHNAVGSFSYLWRFISLLVTDTLDKQFNTTNNTRVYYYLYVIIINNYYSRLYKFRKKKK